MQKLVKIAAAFVLLVLLGVMAAGCSSSALNPALAGNPSNPVNPVNPVNPAVQIRLAAFIQDTSTSSAAAQTRQTTWTAAARRAWKQQFAATLSSVSINSGHRDIYLVNNDGTGLRKWSSQSGDFHSVYLSADEKTLVFAAHASDGYSQIYIVPVNNSSAPVQLTTTPGHKMGPMLTADSSKIVFMQADPATQKFDIATMNADGTNLHVIPTAADWYIWHPAISPDGSKIVVEMWNDTQNVDTIFIMNADGTSVTKLTDWGTGWRPLSFFECPAFSPDGKQVVFSSLTYDIHVYLIDINGGGLKGVAEGEDPLFVGSRIMFVFRSHPSEIYSINPDRTDLKQVTNNTYDDAFEMTM